jgi:hypothetical protein
MTSVSGYKIYVAYCCKTEIKVPIYASVNSSTVFSNPKCKCGKATSKEDMEFIRLETRELVPLSSGGVDNLPIPEFLKSKN